MNFEIFGGRKAFAFFLTLLIGTIVELVKTGGLTETFAMFLVGSAALFIAGNAALSWKGMSVTGSESGEAVQPAAPVDLSPIESQLTSLQENQEKLAGAVAQAALSANNTNKLLVGALKMGQPT
jgi:hypothetical protein